MHLRTCFGESTSNILVFQKGFQQGVHAHEAVIVLLCKLAGSLQHLAHFIAKLHLHGAFILRLILRDCFFTFCFLIIFTSLTHLNNLRIVLQLPSVRGILVAVKYLVAQYHMITRYWKECCVDQIAC